MTAPALGAGGVEAAAAGAGERAAPWLAAAVVAAPVLVARYPPMTDLPQHEALIAALRHLGEAGQYPPGLLVLNLGHGSQLFHLLGWLLSLVVPTDWAVKLVAAGAVAAVPLATAHFAAALGRSRWAGLLAAPLALGWTFRWGFVANLLGVALLLLALLRLDALTAAPTLRRALGLAGWVVLLFLGHESSNFVLGPAAVLFVVARRLRPRQALLCLAPLALGGLLIGLEVWALPALRPQVPTPTLWHPVLAKLLALPTTLYGPRESAEPDLLVVLTGVAVVLLARRGPAAPPGEDWAARLLRRRYEVYAGLLLLCYLTWPFTLLGASLVYQRYLLPAALVALVVCLPVGAGPSRIARVTLGALVLAGLGSALPSFAESHQAYLALDELLPAVQPGSAVVELNLAERPASLSVTNHAHGRITAARGGRSNDSFFTSPGAPVNFNLACRWDDTASRLASPLRFMPSWDFRLFRYALVRLAEPAQLGPVQAALAPEGRLVGAAGPWALFESALEVQSPSAPEPALPRPLPEMLGHRLGAGPPPG